VYSALTRAGILTGTDGGADSETCVDDKIKQLLRELGTAINESISSSEDVSKHIQKIRDEGYNLYVVLDATIGLNRQDEDEEQAEQPAPATTGAELIVRDENRDVQFRINVNDLAVLRGLGIDPTRKVRTTRRVEPLAQNSDE
jgi:nicotinamidase-related amidase